MGQPLSRLVGKAQSDTQGSSLEGQEERKEEAAGLV